MKKRGQMKISFGMIFSIFLIVIFIVFAFYAIKTFLNISDSAKLGKALSKLDTDVDKIWKSSQASQEFSYIVPLKVRYFCFADFSQGSSPKGSMQNIYNDLKLFSAENKNLFFYPMDSNEIKSYEIKNINIEKITQSENPYCIKNENSRITLTIQKTFTENLVSISR